MIYVDGAQKSGSGTIVRLAVGLATLLGEYRIPRLTKHVETNLWLVESILGAEVEVNKNLVKIRGIGYSLGGSTIN